jgi:hypothetical protein
MSLKEIHSLRQWLDGLRMLPYLDMLTVHYSLESIRACQGLGVMDGENILSLAVTCHLLLIHQVYFVMPIGYHFFHRI